MKLLTEEQFKKAVDYPENNKLKKQIEDYKKNNRALTYNDIRYNSVVMVYKDKNGIIFSIGADLNKGKPMENLEKRFKAIKRTYLNNFKLIKKL